MEISWQNGGINDPTTTGGRNGADLNWGGWWPTGVTSGRYLVENHSIDLDTGVGNRTFVSITCGFLHHHQIGAVLTRRDNRRVRITCEDSTSTVVVGEQIASILMFQRYGIELMVGDQQNDSLVNSQLHINITEIRRFGVRFPVPSRYQQVLLALHQLQALLGEDIPGGLRAAMEHFTACWEDSALIRNGTTHDAFLQLREQYAAYDNTYTMEDDLVAHLTGYSGEENINANDTTSEGASLNNAQSTTQQQDTISENTTSSQHTPPTHPQAAKDAIGRRAIELVTQDLESRGQNVINVETATTAQEHLGIDWPGYDLLVDHDLEHEEHVEVKGTRTGEGGNVRLTRIEIEAACTDERATLAVVSSITCYENNEEEWIAEGGQLRYYRWVNTEAIESFLEPLENGTLPGLSGVIGLSFPISPETSHLMERFER